MSREDFLRQLEQHHAEEDKLRASRDVVMRAMRVQKTHVKNLDEVVRPGVAWINSIVALIWMWAELDAHRLVWIVAAHLGFRFVVRGLINVVWLPRIGKNLANRFPEFREQIEGAFEGSADD